MNTKIKNWLDANAKVVTDCGNMYYYIDRNGEPMLEDNGGDCAWIALMTVGGKAVFTDAMDYCNHGFGNGAHDRRREAAVKDVVPQNIWREIVAEYGDDGCDGLDDADRFQADLETYLRDRAGWTPNRDYFDCPSPDVRAAIDALQIPHNAEMDEVTANEDVEA